MKFTASSVGIWAFVLLATDLSFAAPAEGLSSEHGASSSPVALDDRAVDSQAGRSTSVAWNQGWLRGTVVDDEGSPMCRFISHYNATLNRWERYQPSLAPSMRCDNQRATVGSECRHPPGGPSGTEEAQVCNPSFRSPFQAPFFAY